VSGKEKATLDDALKVLSCLLPSGCTAVRSWFRRPVAAV
jgi:hypothetical protein